MTVLTLNEEHTGIVIVDVQTKLMAVMRQRERVIDNIIKLLRLSKIFTLPVILTEQYPKMLGSTVKEIKENLLSYDPIQKMVFDCCQVEYFKNCLESAGLTTIILAGVEAHICVFQTCVSLLERGFNVHVPQDAVDSRTEENWRVGLDLMKKAGAVITSTETIIFQILKIAGTKEFKEILKIIK
ncbi:MAG: isochorismatase family protein [Thermodesulfovibrionia bacterium]|nr:isochorismatase family protein [Thermodesulfovibrionia bacterium]